MCPGRQLRGRSSLKGVRVHQPRVNEQRNLSQREELKMAKQNAPHIVNVGRGIKAKVWTNNGNSRVWHNVTFARTYRDDNGDLQDSDSYCRDDLLHLARAAEKAFDHINSQLQSDEQ
jgi:hypothetical protein